MSLLTMLQGAANELGIPEPGSIVDSTDDQVKQLLALTYRVGKKIRKSFNWPELRRVHTFSVVSSQNNYALPADFDTDYAQSHWNDSSNWRVYGGITEQEWMQRTYGLISSLPQERFRIMGHTDREYHLFPTPESNIESATTVSGNTEVLTLTTGGDFTGSAALDYKVEIDAAGAPDTFRWSDDGGSTWDASGVAITGSAQTLNNGVTVAFDLTTGGTVGDAWTFSTSVSESLVFAYQSKEWFLPRRWNDGIAVAAGSYCFWNGNVYKTTAGGTTGTTAPTHTTGSVTDGGVIWAYWPEEQSQRNSFDNVYTTFTADTDEFLLDEDLVSLGVQAYFLKAKTLPWQDAMGMFLSELKSEMAEKEGGEVLYMGLTPTFKLISSANIPDGSWDL